MKSVSVEMLRSIVRMATEPRADRLAMGDLARWVLELEGDRKGDGIAAPESTSTKGTSTARVQEWRREQRMKRVKALHETRETPSETPSETATETHGETPNTSLSSSPSSSLISRAYKISETGEESARECETPSETPSETRPRNATDDGAFGMLVASWAAGIRSVTGETFPIPGRGQYGGLAAKLREKCGGADPCTEAHALGAAYATAKRGGQLSAAWFLEWIGSGRPDRGSGIVRAAPRGRAVQPEAPPGEETWSPGSGLAEGK